MRREDLRLVFMGMNFVFPPLPRFQGKDLGEFYTAIQDRHPFESLQLQGDAGCFMSTEGSRSLDISRDSITYEEQVEADIDLTRRNVEDLVREAHERLGVPGFFALSFIIRAHWPVPDEARPIGQTLRDHVLSVSEDQYNFLGGVSGVSLVLAGHHEEEPHWHWMVEVAPYLRDESLLYIEVKGEFLDGADTPGTVGERLQIVYDFLWENVARFVGAVLP